MGFLTIFAFSAFALATVSASCPPLSDVSALYNSTHFTCARLYQGPGFDDLSRACNDCDGYWTIPDGYKISTLEDSERFYPIGSAMIMSGCTFMGYKDYNYRGDIDYLYGPDIEGDVQGFADSGRQDDDSCFDDEGYYSFRCECAMKVPSCSPADHWELVADCTGLDTCVVNEATIGVIFSDDEVEAATASDEISDVYRHTLAKIFQQVTSSTGYTWPEGDFMTARNVEVDMGASSGLGLVEQAVGRCGGHVVRSAHFRARTVGNHGEEPQFTYKTFQTFPMFYVPEPEDVPYHDAKIKAEK